MGHRVVVRMSAEHEDNEGTQGRAKERNNFFLHTIVKDGDGKELCTARVRNLSHTGMMAECDLQPSIGTQLSFNLRGIGDVAGKVVRQESGRMGIRFDREVDPMLARKPVGSSQNNKPQMFGY